jgi:hypothetical protein
MAANLIRSEPVDGPDGQRVRVLFYDDGSMRIRVHDAGPMVIAEAFLSGHGKHVIIKLEQPRQ